MPLKPFALVTPSTRDLSAALTRRLLAKSMPPAAKGTLRMSKLGSSVPWTKSTPRLNVVHLDLEDERAIRSAASEPREATGRPRSTTTVQKTFDVNTFSHLLVKRPSRFLSSPPMGNSLSDRPLAKWVHTTARVVSIGGDGKGGWYSYHASKAALNQATHTFDLHLRQTKRPAMAVAIHPGTMKTDLSKGFWNGVPACQIREA